MAMLVKVQCRMVELRKALGLLLHRRGRVASSFPLMNYVLYKLL